MSRVFENKAEVDAFMLEEIDQPCAERKEAVSPGVTLASKVHSMGPGTFTNVYTLSIEPQALDPELRVNAVPSGISETLDTHDLAGTSAGFFYLTDRGKQAPKQSALNLAVGQHQVYGLPVRDREAVLLHADNRIDARMVRAVGSVSIGKDDLTWSGSLTGHEADARVFGTGNAIIQNEDMPEGGFLRVLQDDSRFTPRLHKSRLADVGCRRDERTGEFVITEVERDGQLNIFDHDLVLRVPRTLAKPGSPLKITQLDGQELAGLRGGFTAGPLLSTESFGDHEINADLSLSSVPPFINRRIARLALFGAADGLTHFQLFDARPGSQTFPGVTPNEAVEAIRGQFGEPAWGCFLDPGQTARMVVRIGEELRSLGNRHYLDKMPGAEPGPYTWTPTLGRPTATAIVLR